MAVTKSFTIRLHDAGKDLKILKGDSSLIKQATETEPQKHPSDAVRLVITKRFFFKLAQYSIEYLYDPNPTNSLLLDLKGQGADLFTFTERSFIENKASYGFKREDEPIALLKIKSHDEWWKKQINKKVRNMIRKAEKEKVEVVPAKIDENFVRAAHRIYNETPIRQGRRYVGYGVSLESVKGKFANLQNSEVLGAYLNDELIGLLWMACGDRVARIKSFISLIKHRNTAPSNVLMSEAVKKCCEEGIGFIIYEKMGYLPGLDSFKQHNGFVRYMAPRYYIPLSERGAVAIKLRAHKKIEYSLPLPMERVLLRMYDYASQLIPASVWNQLGED